MDVQLGSYVPAAASVALHPGLTTHQYDARGMFTLYKHQNVLPARLRPPNVPRVTNHIYILSAKTASLPANQEWVGTSVLRAHQFHISSVLQTSSPSASVSASVVWGQALWSWHSQRLQPPAQGLCMPSWAPSHGWWHQVCAGTSSLRFWQLKPTYLSIRTLIYQGKNENKGWS